MKEAKYLVVMPLYWQYGQKLEHAANTEKITCDVFEYEESVSRKEYNNIWEYCVHRVLFKFSGGYRKNYYKKIDKNIAEDIHTFLQKGKNQYDGLVVIKGMVIGSCCLEELNNAIKSNALKILYLWDSLFNTPINLSLEHYGWFSKIYSFDPEDARNKGLMYKRMYPVEPLTDSLDTYHKNNFVFIGIARSDRMALLLKIRAVLRKYGLTYYFNTPRLDRKSKVIYRLFAGSDRFWTTQAVSYDEAICYQKNCDYIIDIPHPGQYGLTGRSIDMDFYKKKIVSFHPFPEKYGDEVFRIENIVLRNIDQFREWVKITGHSYDDNTVDSESVTDGIIGKRQDAKKWLLDFFI